jgi:hypothetical protein
MKHKHSEKGQTALEFTLVAPLLLGAIFLILLVALGWHTHAIASALALEGSVREAVSPGSGFAFVEEHSVPGQLHGYYTNQIQVGEHKGKVFSVRGLFHVPLKPLGLSLDTYISSSSLAPKWKFVP